MPSRFVVSEITKNWTHDNGGPPVSIMFEKIINHWDSEGYKMLSFQLAQITDGDGGILTETIIAVFERKDA